MRTIAKVPLRRGEVDQDFDQEELAKLLDQAPFNVAVADLYRSRFRKVPGVVYTAGVKHANNVAAAFRDAGINAQAVSGETPKRELAEILAGFERGEVDVLCNAMLLAEGWNSPRATICMHLAPTASRRVYQQRVGRVTRRAPGKEAGLVIDFVHPATTHDETIVTLHSLLDRDVYRGGAIVVGPVRRGRGRRVRVERRVVPVSADPERRLAVLERELWRIAVENLNFSEQHAWAALAGARVDAEQLAPRQGDAPARPVQGAAPPLPADLRPAQPQPPAAPQGAGRDRRAARPRGLRRRGRHRRHLAARRPARRRQGRCSRRSPSAASAAATRPRPGSGASPRTPASCTRSTRSSAGPRPSACWACSSTPPAAPTAATPAASSTRRATRTAASRSRCSPPRSPTRPRPRRSCAAPACAWPASPRPSPASCFATSPSRAASAGAGAGARAGAGAARRNGRQQGGDGASGGERRDGREREKLDAGSESKRLGSTSCE